MLDFNFELLDWVINGFEALNKFASIHPDFEVKLKDLSPKMFSEIESFSTEGWYFNLTSKLIEPKIKDVEISYFDDSSDVIEILESNSYEVLDIVHDIVREAEQGALEVSYSENIDCSAMTKCFDEVFEDYCSDLGLKRISFNIDLNVSELYVLRIFDFYAPKFLKNIFKLEGEYLVSCEYDEFTSRIELLSLENFCSDFADHIDAPEAHESFLSLLESINCVKGKVS